jgi:hypothetical protein
MRRKCEVTYGDSGQLLTPLFNGGVTINNHKAYADSPSVPITANTRPISITIWLEEGQGAIDASPELRKFLMARNWVEVY